jgi:hypothetical protein
VNDKHDPVDSAFEALRTETWSAKSFDPDLESKLMQQFNRNSQPARLTHPKNLIVAVAILFVGGGTFAATGGITAIKNLLRVTVEIDGETTDLTIPENGETTFEVETADGGTAQVNIQTDTSDDGMMRRVEVRRADGDTEDVEVNAVKRRVMGAPAEVEWDALGDAEPLTEWTDANGIFNELYMVAAAEGDGTRFLAALDADSEEARLIQLNEMPMDFLDGSFEVNAEVSKDGVISIQAADKNGREMEFKIVASFNGGGNVENIDRNLDVQTPDGEIRVTIEPESNEN